MWGASSLLAVTATAQPGTTKSNWWFSSNCLSRSLLLFLCPELNFMKFMTIVMWWVTCMDEEEEDCRLKCNQSSSTTALWPSSSIDWQYVGKATSRPNYTLNSFSFRSKEVNLVSNQTIIDVHFSFPQTYINGNKSKTLAASFRCVFFSGQTSLKVDVGQKDFVYLLSSYFSPRCFFWLIVWALFRFLDIIGELNWSCSSEADL